MKKNAGFTLVEVMIGVGLLGGIIAGYMQLSQSSNRAQREIMDRGNITLSMKSIKNDVLADSAFIPAYPLNPFTEKADDPANTAAKFFTDNPTKVAFRCYDRFGIRQIGKVLADCPLGENIQSWFFKAAVRDNSILSITDGSDPFKGQTDLARIPLSRFYFKVMGSVGAKDKGRVMTYYFSSLKTDVNNF